jgi:hypothetical protein
MHGFPFLSFYPFYPFHIIFLLTSTGQTGEPISMVDGSNDAFPPKEVPFGVSLQKFDLTGSATPKNRQKVGVVYGFPAKLGESIKTRISVKSRDIDTKLETYMETKGYTLDFGSKVIYYEVQDGGSRHYEKIQTVITQSIFIRFR